MYTCIIYFANIYIYIYYIFHIYIYIHEEDNGLNLSMESLQQLWIMITY